MQHYIHLGLGFSAEILTKKQADDIYLNSTHDRIETDIGLKLVPFTEDYEGNSWATIVVKDFGAISTHGKMDYIDSITNQANNFKLTPKQLIQVVNMLKEFNIEHLLEKIKPIIYSEHY